MTELRNAALRGCFCCGESDSLFSAPSRRGFMLGAGALALTAATGGGRAGHRPPIQNRFASTSITISRRRPM